MNTLNFNTLRCAFCVAIVLLFSANPLLAGEPLRWRQLGEPGVGGAVTSIAIDPLDSRHVMVGGDMLGIGRSDDGGRTWSQADANAGLRGYEIADFTSDPSRPGTIWVGTMDGPARSTDNGHHWTPMRNGLPADNQFLKFIAPVQKIWIDPKQPGHLLAFGGNKRSFDDGKCENYGAVWESGDDGASWKLRGRVDPAHQGHEANITAIVVNQDGKAIYASVPRYGVMKSDDAGATWTPANGGLPDKAVLCITGTGGQLWVSTEKHGVYRSEDQGLHWIASSKGLPGDGTFDTVAVAPSDPRVVYVNAKGPNKTFRSTDGGKSWQNVISNGDDPFGESLVTSCLAIDPNHADNVFIGTFVSIYHSVNGGTAWIDASATRVDEKANTWRGNGYSGLIGLNYAWNPFDPKMSIGQTMDDGKLLLSRDDQHSWKVHHSGMPAYSGGGGVSFSRDAHGPVIYAAVGTQIAWFTHDGVYKSLDNGGHWTLTATPPGNQGASWVWSDPAQPEVMLAVFQDRRLYRSSDGGAHWTKLALRDGAGRVERAVVNVVGDSLTASPKYLWAAARGGIYESRDGGSSFTYMASSPSSGADWDFGDQHVKVDPTRPRGLLVINVNGINSTDGIYRYDGSAWSKKLAGSYAAVGEGLTDAAVDPTDGQRLVAICDHQPFMDVSVSTGVWLSEDGGKSWRQENQGLGMLRGRFIAFRPDGRQILAATNGGGFYVADLK